jgi:cbb3-type cytochrome oxidase cytochrome c subunit
MARAAAMPLVLAGLTAGLVVGCGTGVNGQERLVSRGRQLFMDHGCHGCHTVGAMGSPIGPDLSRIGARRDAAYLDKWLRDPAQQKPTAHMPKIAMSEQDVRALASYLASLR